ncbi:hypothetical protein F2P56_007049 [Juglans regia]|uniref:Uncharacterized protein n=2 Tax=Juglans regia TaxID=51240 RepID=A0A833Y370_JUGRE|nr:uncharacterized protein LOC108998058 [Juglans regia]KAF5475219.1 hypothetical protein F2P56_007049 [Juglans regia]
MPSGGKKRRAAKKKKGSETHTIKLSTNNTRGNDDWSQDGKESDNSPASRDQDSDQNPFNEGSEDLEERDPSSIQSFVAEDKSMEGFPINVEGVQKIGLEDDGVIEIERELKSGENFESKNGSIEHVELAKESHDGNDQSSSSSSSDDEARVTNGKPKEAYNSVLEASSYDDLVKPVDSSPAEVMWVNENPSVGETVNLIAETAPFIESVKTVASVSQETSHRTESAPVENPVIADVVESGPKENPLVESPNLMVSVPQETIYMTESASIQNQVIADVVESGPKENPVVEFPNPAVSVSLETIHMTESAPVENPVFADVVESGPKENPLVESPNPAVSVSHETIHLTESAPVENTVVADVVELGPKENPLVESPKPALSVSLERIHMTESAPVVNPVVADVVESRSNESDEKLLRKSSQAPVAVMDLTMNNNEDSIFPLSNDNVQASLAVVESVSNGYEVKILPSSSVPVAATSDSAAHVKDSEIPEYSERQPPLAPAPQMVKRTSWLSCCGLFEVLTGTGR